MRNKLVFILLLLAFIMKSLAGTVTDKSKIARNPNVIIILTDDLGYGDISCYGQKSYITPQIDKLADEGVRCTDFYVPTPYCAPSRATLLTGRFPLRHGVIQNPAPDAGINDVGISTGEITLGEVYQNAGYKTKLIGKWHLGHKPEFFPVKHGFDEYYGILYSNDMRPVQIIENMDTVEYPVDQSILTKKYTEKAIDFIERNQNQPFFLHLCHAMPHKPLAASKDFYTPETPGDLYTDVISELDWSVGQVLSTLEKLKILDKTIVIFMSDNGPWYGGSAGRLKGMKATTWDGGTRVPFIIRYPEVFSPKTIDVPCWSADIFPTLLALSKVKSMRKTTLDGQNITEILKGNQTGHAPVFTMHNAEIMTVRKGDWKLFVREPKYWKETDLSNWKDPRGPDGSAIIAPMVGQANPGDYPGIIPLPFKNKILLFNLRNDPAETVDLSTEKPEIVNELMKEYQKFEASLNLKNKPK